MARPKMSEAGARAKDARETRRDQEVAALEAELAGYEARHKSTRDADAKAALADRISDVKKEIARAKKGHGNGPAGRVTDPTGGSNPPPAPSSSSSE